MSSSSTKGHDDGSSLGTQQKPHQNDPTIAADGSTAATAAVAVDEATGVENKQQIFDKSHQRKKDGRGSIRMVDPSPGREGGSLEEEAAVGSIHHILKTAFKELYEEAPPDDTEQQSATLASNGSPAGGEQGPPDAMAETSIADSAEGKKSKHAELSPTCTRIPWYTTAVVDIRHVGTCIHTPYDTP